VGKKDRFHPFLRFEVGVTGVDMINNEAGNSPVSPTSPENPGNQYDNFSRVDLFGVYVQYLSAERQLIWERFSAMLIANTIILNVVDNTYSNPTQWLFTGTACVFGILLCIVWFRITRNGWNHTDTVREVAGGFRWEGYQNPFSRIPPQRDTIRRAAYFIIVFFIIIYVLILIYASTLYYASRGQ
jgi:hypothetical protein